MKRVSLRGVIPAFQLLLFILSLFSIANNAYVDAITDETGSNLSAASVRNDVPTQRQIARYRLWNFYYRAGYNSSREATYFFSISAMDLSSQASILIEASWWDCEYLDNSFIDFVVLIKDPADRLIDNHTIPYGTNAYTTSFTPNTTGGWRVVLGFEGTFIPTTSEPHDAYIAIDYRVTVSGVNTAVRSYCTETRAEPPAVKLLPFSDSVALGAAYWFLVHSSGRVSPRTGNYDRSIPNPIEKVNFIHYPTEKALSISFSETDYVTSGEAQIEDPYIGFWKMEIAFRSDHSIEFVLLSPCPSIICPANLYLIPDDGRPPFVDEDCDGIADIEDPSVDTTQGLTMTQSRTMSQDTEPTNWLPGFEWMALTMLILILSIRSLRSRLL